MTDEPNSLEDVREALRSAGKARKGSEIASALKVTPSTVSRWISGKLAISPSDEMMLRLYFFGTIPFEITNEKLLNRVLDFTEDQYRVICILASRRGTTPAKWIADQIRSYLAFNDEAKAETSKIVAARMARNASHLTVMESPKVAENHPVPIPIKKEDEA